MRAGILSLVFIICLLVFPAVIASDDITMTLDQTDYYFKVGEEAMIPMNIENTYGTAIDGVLSYSITQKIVQGNFQYSSSNSKSKSLTAENGESNIGISFGTSESPSTMNVGLSYNYNFGNEQRVVDLDDITIHFVSDDSQKQNEQNPVQSSSEKYSQPKKQNDPFSQQEQQMQQMMDQMLGNQQQPQNAEQRLQNNQMSQDSSALKKQMQKQIEEQQQMKEEFQKQLAKNEEFQEEHQDLLEKGYNISDANFNPSSNNTGDFEINYQKPNGEEASLKGSMENGELNDLQKETSEQKQNLIDQLRNNEEFKKLDEQLQNEGFSEQNVEVSTHGNDANVRVNYNGINNETAAINAEIVNGTVNKIELEKEGRKKSYMIFWIFGLIILVCFAGYFIYRKFYRKIPEEKKKKIVEKPFDYKSESRVLLDKAKTLFEKKEYKDAYMLAGQSLRLYLSHDNDLKKEITNDEIISFLRKHKKPFKDAKECFDLCSLVEFARYQANRKDFDRIIEVVEKNISSNS